MHPRRAISNGTFFTTLGQFDFLFIQTVFYSKRENLSQVDSTWRIRYIAINILLLILMIFFTTPSILIDTFSRWSHDFNFDTYFRVSAFWITPGFLISLNFFPIFKEYMPNYLSEFLPSFLLRIFSSLLPVLVGYTALLEKHWTKSVLSVFFFFLIFHFKQELNQSFNSGLGITVRLCSKRLVYCCSWCSSCRLLA